LNILVDNMDFMFFFLLGVATSLKISHLQNSSHFRGETVRGPNEKEVVRVLALDGGGTLGLIEAYIVAQIEQETEKPVRRLFNYIAGTSTGAILGAMLAFPLKIGNTVPYSGTEAVDQYKTSLSKGILGDVTKYENVLKEVLGQTKLGEAIVPMLLSTARGPQKTCFAFESTNLDQSDILVWQTVRASSALEGLFSPASIDGVDGVTFVDGVKCNQDKSSPALVAYQWVKQRHSGPNVEFRIYSVGPTEESNHWGQQLQGHSNVQFLRLQPPSDAGVANMSPLAHTENDFVKMRDAAQQVSLQEVIESLNSD
jgi:hypothetical protein